MQLYVFFAIHTVLHVVIYQQIVLLAKQMVLMNLISTQQLRLAFLLVLQNMLKSIQPIHVNPVHTVIVSSVKMIYQLVICVIHNIGLISIA